MAEKSTEFVARMKEAVRHVRMAQDIMAQGPLEYYLGKLVEHSEALLERFSPIKVGQKAIIVRPVKCENGWAGKDKTLAVGATGTVVDVDFSSGRFWFDFVPDRDWWQDDNGEFREIERPYSYRLSENVLAGVTGTGG